MSWACIAILCQVLLFRATFLQTQWMLSRSLATAWTVAKFFARLLLFPLAYPFLFSVSHMAAWWTIIMSQEAQGHSCPKIYDQLSFKMAFTTKALQDVGLTEWQKAGKQGRDVSIKVFRMQHLCRPILPLLHNEKRCRDIYWIVLCYHPVFCCSAIPTSHIFGAFIACSINFLLNTVEPPNKGHCGSRAFVLFSEVVLWWEVQANMQFIAPHDLIYLDSMY